MSGEGQSLAFFVIVEILNRLTPILLVSYEKERYHL